MENQKTEAIYASEQANYISVLATTAGYVDSAIGFTLASRFPRPMEEHSTKQWRTSANRCLHLRRRMEKKSLRTAWISSLRQSVFALIKLMKRHL